MISGKLWHKYFTTLYKFSVMTDKKSKPSWEEHKNQTPQQDIEGSKKETIEQQRPQERLKDGTNDFQNGDQEPTSERSSKEDNESS
jgi:hypothetical protein